jgi:hypothetical protein
MNMTEGSVTPGPHGPQVIPGVYKLKLNVDGQVYSSEVTIVNDPRVGQSPELMAGLRTQNKLSLLSLEGMKQSYTAFEEAAAIRSQLAALQSTLPADLAAQAKTLDASLLKVGGAMPAGGGFGGGGARRGPAEPNAVQPFFALNSDFSTLVSMMQVGLDMAPTPTQIATWEKDCTTFNQTDAAWKTTQQQLADFNAALAKNNLQPIKLSIAKLTEEPCTFKPELSTKKPELTAKATK